MHDSCTAIAAMRSSLDQTLRFKPVNGSRDRSARQQHLPADLVHRQRAFVQERFEHGEIRRAKLELRDAAQGVRLDRVQRFPQHQENVYASSPAQRLKIAFSHLS
jgi:hypothetical protein